MARERRRRRRGGNSQESNEPKAPPYIKRKIPYYEILDEEGLQTIEHNADTILEEIGIDFLEDPESIDLFRQAGAEINGERVHFPRGMCREIIQKKRSVSLRNTHVTPRAMCKLVATIWCWYPPMAHHLCTIWTTGVVTPPLKIFVIS